MEFIIISGLFTGLVIGYMVWDIITKPFIDNTFDK